MDGAEQKGWLRRLLPFLLAHRRNLVASFAASLAGMLLAALGPWIQKVVVDDAILGDRRSLGTWLGFLAATGVGRFGFAFVRRYAGGRVALDVQYDLRNTIFDHLQRLDFARHDELQTGQLVSRASSDVALIQALLAVVPVSAGNLLMFVVSIGIMATLSVPLTLVTLLVVPSILVVALRMRGSVFPANWDAQQRAAEVAGVVDEAVTGVRIVKAFGQEARELDRLSDAAGDLYRSRLRAIRLQARYQAALQAIPVLGQVAVLGFGGWLAVEGRISLGTFLAFASYLAQLVTPVRMLAVLFTVGQQARAGAERIFELLDSNPAVRERLGADELPRVRGAVALEGVTFGYLRSEPVLRDVTIRVRPGETVALVGASGSGKSTVSLLVPRFYDVQSGTVRIDGVDVRDVTLTSLRRQIGVVFEESFLFSDSIRENIAYGHPEATDEQVVAAARAAEAHDFVEALPDGYATVVGERGLTLSGGQRQRIALARALLTDPRVLLLDDATSAVDARTEEEIHATLRRLLADRTTILVAHRRSTLRLADRIVVLERGEVVDEGTHAELVERCSTYRRLVGGPGDDAEGIDADPLDANCADFRKDACREPAQLAGGRAVRARVDVGTVAAQPGAGFLAATTGAGLPATPELLAALDRLPPVPDDHVDVSAQRDDRPFSFRAFVRPYRGALAVGALLVAFDALATLAGPLLVRRGIDQGVAAGSTGAVLVATSAFLAIALADWFDVWALTRYTGRTAERLLLALRVRIFAQLQRLGVDFYEHEMAGRIMTRMTSDVEALSQLLQTGLVGAIVNLVTFAGVAVLLLVVNLRLALVAMTVLPPLIVATVVFRRLSDRAYTRARDRIAAVNANLQESLSGVRVAQAFVREGASAVRFRAVNAEHLDARVDAQRLQSMYFPFVELLSVVATALVLGAGAAPVRDGDLTPGGLIAFLLLLTMFFAPVQQLSQVFDTWQQARAAIAKIGEVLVLRTSTPPPDRPVDPGRLAGDVHLDGVRFRYAGATTDALAGVDLHVPAGQTVALVGETGAGKSTVVKLLARFHDPVAGAVRVDGRDVRDLDPAAYRSQLGYVPQDAFLFSGTIRDNVAYGRPEASDDEVRAAARAVGADDFIRRLPGGYDHPVSERGRSLSAGQRQLLALARAELVDPAILLLDEATSNLDLGTEGRVSRAMGAVASGRTTIVIAHRLQTARRAERVVVLAGGRVVEDGTHDDLVRAGGTYARMWAAFAEAGDATHA